MTQLSDTTLPFGGTWTWAIEPSSEGCSVRVTEDGFVTNPIFRFVSRFIMGHHATMDARLKDIAAQLGEPSATIEE